MSGGFFRGTSADQDTRFSNKQAKLLKSQKFAPELDHLVDMKKVNMEVVKPWITRRVTELLGFEDEVLINFINGLLDVKEVNGKEVQIQITGFMEKNTGKFMKELWTLLLSAQQTASGVPQQLLDAKLEDLRQRNMENDRIASEIQRKKDRESGREIEPERLKNMDDGFDSKESGANVERVSKVRDADEYLQHRNGEDKRNGVKARKRGSRSPHSSGQSSSHRVSPSRSISRSKSHSISHSGQRSRSISISPLGSRGRSLSRERNSPRRWSISPRRRWYSPRRRHSSWRSPSPRRRPSYSRRRSRSRSIHRSPTPIRRRVRPYHRSPPLRRGRSPSPIRRRRSRSPIRRRRSPSPSPRRRSPSSSPSPPPRRRHRSPSLVQRSISPLPVRRRSPSPVRLRSPVHLKRRSYSPTKCESPVRGQERGRESPMPQQRLRSPLPCKSPVPGRRRLSNPPRQRSASIDEWSSQSPERPTSPSPRRKYSKRQRSPVQSSRDRTRNNLSPEMHQPPGSMRSPLTDEEYHLKNKPQISLSSPEMSLGPSRSLRKGNVSENKRSNSPFCRPERPTGEKLTHERSLSPPKKIRERKPGHGSTEISENEETDNSRRYTNQKLKSLPKDSVYGSPGHMRIDSLSKVHNEDNSSGRSDLHPKSESFNHDDKTQARKGFLDGRSDKSSGRKSPMSKNSLLSGRLHETSSVDVKLSDEKGRHRSSSAIDSGIHRKSEALVDSGAKIDNTISTAIKSSCSEESNKQKHEMKNRRKHKRSERKEPESDEGYSSDSELEDKKEAKRRKKEDKKLRKEERRRRREVRRRRRHERRAEKLKTKNKREESSDGDEVVRRDSHQSDEEPPDEQKRLEIELRNKALESLKAKKGVGH